MTELPEISIVMPSYQQVDFLEAAVESVLAQKVSLELLVFDPGSTDGSRELLARLAARHGDRLRLFFEQDGGQSDAINKGMARARGRILGWLNSDDLLLPGALGIAKETLLGRPEPAWMYGSAGMIDAAGKPVAGAIVAYKRWRGRHFSRLKLLVENFIPQMAVFWNREMWQAAGPLDAAKHLDMDYDLWLRFAARSDPIVVADDLAVFRVHGEAKGSRSTGEQLAAALRTARSHAAPLGLRGRLALLLHRICGLRTRVLYRFMKPRRTEGLGPF